MKFRTLLNTTFAVAALARAAFAETPEGYENFIWQIQRPSGLEWSMPVPHAGSKPAELPIEEGGATFELWTIKGPPLVSNAVSYHLNTAYVGVYAPVAKVEIFAPDQSSTGVPRTRADIPFSVHFTISGLRSGEGDPPASKSVNLTHHVQSYGPAGNGQQVDPSQATLLKQWQISRNEVEKLDDIYSSLPGADFTLLRGEERFSVFSLKDGGNPAQQLATGTIQVWPVEAGAITGVTKGQIVRGKIPAMNFRIDRLFPGSKTFVQYYKGNMTAAPTRVETTLPIGIPNTGDHPLDRDMPWTSWDGYIDEDGPWSVELWTDGVFGAERVAGLDFTVNRSLRVNGGLATME